MRGRIIPVAFLVFAMMAAFWLSASRTDTQWADGWQTAGVSETGAQVGSGPTDANVLIGFVGSVVAGGPAEAQGRAGEGSGGTGSRTIARPRFSRITIAPGQEANFTGSGPAGHEVTLKLNGELLGTASIDSRGTWKMTAPAFGAGDHRVQLSIEPTVEGSGLPTEGQEVRIAIPEGAGGSEIVAFEEDDRRPGEEDARDAPADPRLRDQAERLAREASREFDAFTDRKKATRDEARRAAQAEEKASNSNDGDRESGGTQSFDPIAPIEEWFSKSSRDYFDRVVPELARRGPRQTAIREKKVPLPERPEDVSADRVREPAMPDLAALATRVQDWLREANRTYQEEVVVDLSRRGARTEARDDATGRPEPEAVRRPSLQTAERDAERQDALDVQAKDAARRAVEERQSAAARRLQEQRATDARRSEEERQAALESKRRLDELLAKREAETRSAEEADRIEAQRAETQKREEERLLAQERARAEEDRRAALLARQDEARKQEEARRLKLLLAEQDAARKRAEEEKKQREAERLAERERQLRLETERVAREAVERERQAAEERRREAAEPQLRIAREEEAEAARRDARIAAKSERADRIARLADDMGFGRKPDASTPGRTGERQQEIALPERKRDADRRSTIANRGDRDGMRRPEREDGRIAANEGRRSREAGEEREPAETIVRRRDLESANGLGGPEVRRRGSLKDYPRTTLDDETGARLAGWRQWAEPIDTGCKDRRAGQTIRVPGTYVVARGDTLWQISWRHYNNGELYRRIYRANRRKIRNVRRIYPCQHLWLPRM